MEQLLTQSRLMINGKPYRFIELEMYYYSNAHQDTTVHRDEEQKLPHHFYFHRAGGKSYKGGTFKGLDVTLGSPDRYMGILIRSIQNVETNEIITGPCNCVNHILGLYDVSSIAEFVAGQTMSYFENHRNFIIQEVEKEKIKMYFGPRVGLNPEKHSDEWISKPYRVSTSLKVKHHKLLIKF